MANEPAYGSMIIAAVKPNRNAQNEYVTIRAVIDDSYDPPRLLVHMLGNTNAALPGVYTEKLEYSGGLLIYQGWTAPGTATSAAGWAIVKYTYTGTAVTDKQWAGGSVAFAQIWDDRAGLTYA
jgi:hypothetical protein